MSVFLNDFIKHSYKAGKTHNDIRAALLQAGWDKTPVEEALGRFVDQDYPVAIPRPVLFASPRLIFLNVFHFLVLYLTLYYAVSLIFTFLDYHLPDGLGNKSGLFYSSYRPLGDEIRDNLAVIICATPLVWWSHKILSRAMEKTRQRIPRIRLKLIYFTMFVGACVLLGNAIGFVYYFLSGELGIRFVIKIALLSFLVFGLYLFYRPQIQKTESET